MAIIDQPTIRTTPFPPTSAPIPEPLRDNPSIDLDLLGAITAGLARSPASWEPLVAFDDERPHVELLLPSNRYDVYVGSWGPGHELPLGSGSCGAVTVVAGDLVLIRNEGVQRHAHIAHEGDTVLVPSAADTTIRNLGPAPAVTIHVIERPAPHGLSPR